MDFVSSLVATLYCASCEAKGRIRLYHFDVSLGSARYTNGCTDVNATSDVSVMELYTIK